MPSESNSSFKTPPSVQRRVALGLRALLHSAQARQHFALQSLRHFDACYRSAWSLRLQGIYGFLRAAHSGLGFELTLESKLPKISVDFAASPKLLRTQMCSRVVRNQKSNRHCCENEDPCCSYADFRIWACKGQH